MLNLPQADACHPQPVFLQSERSSAGLCSLLRFAVRPLACSLARWRWRRWRWHLLLSHFPGPKQGQLPTSNQLPSSCSCAFNRWGWETKVRRALSAVPQIFARCCYYIKEAAGEIMYAKVLCKL